MPELDVTVIDNSDLFKDAFQAQIRMAIKAVGIAAEKNAKKEIKKAVYDTPERGYKRTGRLRNSITHVAMEENRTVYIGTPVEYAAFVELGTSKMKPRPYLKPAAENYKDEYRGLVEKALKS